MKKFAYFRVAALAAASALAAAGFAQQQLVPAPGAPKVPTFQRAANSRPGGTPIRVGFGLAGFQQAAAAAFIASQYDPQSPNYHQWISTYEFGQRFGASASDIQAVEAFLTKYGFSNFTVGQSNSFIIATGTFAGAEKAFNTTLNNYVRPAALVAKGEPTTFYAPGTAPTIPASIASKVSGVFGLANLALGHPNLIKANKKTKKQGVAYVPAQLSTAYHESILHTAGFTGQNMKIAIFSPTGRALADPIEFSNDLKIPLNWIIADVEINGGPSDASGAGEASLDLETIIGQAPGSIIFAMEPPAGTTDADYETGELAGYDAVGTIGDIPVLSSSWDLEEATVIAEGSQSYATTFENVCMGLAASGVSIFNSSGDAAAYSNTGSGTVTTKLETCCPYLTSVGGTHLVLTSANVWSSESLWTFSGTPTKSPEGGGGGISKLYTMPSWQTGPGVQKSGVSNGNREVPDVAAVADPSTGYGIISEGEVSVVGGTSGATPLWASSILLIEQYYASLNKAPVSLGLINPSLYQVATDFENAATDKAGLFYCLHDITSGTNGVYPCTADYDMAAGWGSADFNKLSKDLGYIYKVTGLTPNYAPYNPPHATEPAWTSAITISSSTSTISEPSTFSHLNRYFFDVAMVDSGQADAPQSTFTISIDGKVVDTATCPAMASSTAMLLSSVYATYFTAGTHTISLTVNTGNIPETGRSDNTFTRTITVS